MDVKISLQAAPVLPSSRDSARRAPSDVTLQDGPSRASDALSHGSVDGVWGAWDALADLVRGYEPSVILLLPRKPVRMREALELDFGAGALIITDLAIPFARRWLRGARVAVVDDFVNVGSTMSNALACALEAGASDIAAFAITSRAGTPKILGDVPLRFAEKAPLDDAGMREFGRRVPATLQQLAKPYDLDFPLFQCRLAMPLNGFSDLFASLREKHGDEQVYDLSTPEGSRAGVRRLAVDLTDDGDRHLKVRMYYDERSLVCRVMPIGIPEPIGDSLSTWWSPLARATWDSVSAGPLVQELEADARARLWLFCSAIDDGGRFVESHGDLLVLDRHAPLDLRDAELVLGPGVRKIAQRVAVAHTALEPKPSSVPTAANTSPFLVAAERNGFFDDVRQRAPRFPASAFVTIFERLADWVGAQDLDAYRFAWPEAGIDVKTTPYARLRIGPTIPDLVEMVADVCELPVDVARRHVTRLLDRAIDAGGVVPTIAIYGDRVFRIYRKGEGSLRDRSAQRLLWAWRTADLNLSLTRASKLLTIMDFATPVADKALSVGAQQRGTVLAYQPDLLDAGGDAVHYWAATGQLRELPDEEAPDATGVDEPRSPEA
jgi:hypothetical protein